MAHDRVVVTQHATLSDIIFFTIMKHIPRKPNIHNAKTCINCEDTTFFI